MRTLFVALAVFGCHLASATDTWTAVGNVTGVEVVEGGFAVSLSTSLPSCTSGLAPNTVWIEVGQGPHTPTADDVKMMLTAVMSALVSGKTVDVMYDNSTSYCWGAYVQVFP